MTFHESFWLAVGAAAPVIALANVVSYGDVAAYEYSFMRAKKDKGLDPRRQQFAKRGMTYTTFVYVASAANLVVQAGALALALISLGTNEDTLWLPLPGVVEVYGLIILIFIVLNSGYAKDAKEQLEAPSKAKFPRRAPIGPGLRPGPRRQARQGWQRLQGQRRAVGASAWSADAEHR